MAMDPKGAGPYQTSLSNPRGATDDSYVHNLIVLEILGMMVTVLAGTLLFTPVKGFSLRPSEPVAI